MSSTPTTSEATETGGGQPATEAWGDAETDAVDGLEMLDDALFVERDEELRLPTHTNAEDFRYSVARARASAVETLDALLVVIPPKKPDLYYGGCITTKCR